MSRIVVEGGTDIAEVGLFCVDELPAAKTSDELFTDLQRKEQALRMPTGADGGYLLHVFVDEDVPEDVLAYCDREDLIQGRLGVRSGRMAFGGVESAYAEYAPNPNIRNDFEVPPGDYIATAYHTDYPEDLVEDAIKAKIGEDGWTKVSEPNWLGVAGIVFTIVALTLGINVTAWFLLVAALIAAGTFASFRRFGSDPERQRLVAAMHEVESGFPSIVVHMASSAAEATD